MKNSEKRSHFVSNCSLLVQASARSADSLSELVFVELYKSNILDQFPSSEPSLTPVQNAASFMSAGILPG